MRFSTAKLECRQCLIPHFYFSGDGKLGGIVKPNDGSCHLDAKGVYTHSSDLDYPSVSQINHKVKSNSVNIIFAVTEEQFGVYDLLQQNVEGSSVGTLSNDSSNIVELVKAQYQVKILGYYIEIVEEVLKLTGCTTNLWTKIQNDNCNIYFYV